MELRGQPSQEYSGHVLLDADLGGVAEPKGPKYASSDYPSMNGILEMLSQRWTASIVCSLKDGLSRFNAISRKHKVNPNTLKTRLRDLEAAGIVVREVESTMPPKVKYTLSPKGYELAEIFEELGQWVEKYETEIAVSRAILPDVEPRHAAIMVSEEQAEYDEPS